MTSNQIKNREVENTREIKQEELKERKRENTEKERSNRENERLKGREVTSKTVTGLLGSAVKAFTNDPSWYNLDKQLVSDVANVSFFNPLGTRFPIKSPTRLNLGDGIQWPFAVPTYMKVLFIPTFGDQDVLNVAAKNIYAYVRHANSGHTNYEAADLMQYIIAVDSVLMGLSHLQKVYRSFFKSDSANLDDPTGRLLASGVGYYASVDSNELANYRFRYNTLVTRFNSWNVPAVFPLFNRHVWLSRYFFKDANVRKAQRYSFIPAVLYKYDDVNAKCVAVKYDPAGMDSTSTIVNRESMYEATDFNYYADIVSDLLDALFASEDAGIMSGDVLKAYGEGGIIHLDSLPSDIAPDDDVLSNEVLSQITNASLLGPLAISNGELDITQNELSELRYMSGGLKAPILPSVADIDDVETANKHYHVLNFYKDGPTSDDVMVATRLSVVESDRTSETSGGLTSYYEVYDHFGTEVCTLCHVIVPRKATSTEFGQRHYVLQFYDGIQVTIVPNFSRDDTIYSWPCITAILSSFDWAPRIRLGSIRTTVNRISRMNILYDNIEYENFAILNEFNLRNMHSVAVNSELNIPSIAKTVAKKFS